MKALALLLACCVASAALAGCSDDDDDPEPTPTGSSSSTSTSGGPRGNGTIEVLVNRTTPNGPAPLTVNFTLDAVFRTAAGPVAPKPASLRWEVLLANASSNGTHDDALADDVQNGTSLPANVTLELASPGNVSVLARVHAAGFASGNATFLVLVNATTGGGAALFFEGGESDTSQWTLSSNVYLNPNLGTPDAELPEAHPDGDWAITDSGARTGTHAWLAPYPDAYRGRMTSVAIPIPAGGATLSYYVKGGAESNSIDGVHVLVAEEGGEFAEVAYHSDVIADWTLSEVDLGDFAGKSVQLQFRMDSDMGCSSSPSPPAGCGSGYDAGGILVDDITVA